MGRAAAPRTSLSARPRTSPASLQAASQAAEFDVSLAVKRGHATVEPSGAELLPHAFKEGVRVYGEWVGDGVWLVPGPGGAAIARAPQFRSTAHGRFEVKYKDGGGRPAR